MFYLPVCSHSLLDLLRSKDIHVDAHWLKIQRDGYLMFSQKLFSRGPMVFCIPYYHLFKNVLERWVLWHHPYPLSPLLYTFLSKDKKISKKKHFRKVRICYDKPQISWGAKTDDIVKQFVVNVIKYPFSFSAFKLILDFHFSQFKDLLKLGKFHLQNSSISIQPKPLIVIFVIMLSFG
jgi:hypothetical protein